MMCIELESGLSGGPRERRDSRGSHGESDSDSTDLDDENYHEVVYSLRVMTLCGKLELM